jgi:lipopolysaccharide/colanic/teichoic acid biosynthesis glycosyltransferase
MYPLYASKRRKNWIFYSEKMEVTGTEIYKRMLLMLLIFSGLLRLCSLCLLINLIIIYNRIFSANYFSS